MQLGLMGTCLWRWIFVANALSQQTSVAKKPGPRKDCSHESGCICIYFLCYHAIREIWVHFSFDRDTEYFLVPIPSFGIEIGTKTGLIQFQALIFAPIPTPKSEFDSQTHPEFFSF